ncbi:acetate/propionate family kinase [uncultured Jatrophihabitans sp.]|uniref:acetate/propionate family kinase n=1 Tax=uncultured Jatrophihabitans sp. TaxID=1610747 RepID=UPI0035CB652F
MNDARSTRVLTVNAGSSSVKLRLLDGDVVERSAELPAGSNGFDEAALAATLRDWPAPDAAGHRVVHGGTLFSGPVLVTSRVREELGALTDLAPLHQPKSLAALDAVTELLPHVPAVASFDTAFHATIPPAASTYAVPAEWRTRWGVRRYGFHGLSHAYASRRAAELSGRPPDNLRVVTCHLGAGASLAAVVDGRSVDTTMGFTPLDGLVMATRSGSIDPGLVLWLEEHEQLSPREVATALEEQSGLTALASTGDMRVIQASAAAGDPGAVLALEVYLHSLVAGVATMTAALGGSDALVFTGGVGERSAEIRVRAAAGLAFLGIAVDEARNVGPAEDRDISASGAAVSTFVVAAREDLALAREARSICTM